MTYWQDDHELCCRTQQYIIYVMSRNSITSSLLQNKMWVYEYCSIVNNTYYIGDDFSNNTPRYSYFVAFVVSTTCLQYFWWVYLDTEPTPVSLDMKNPMQVWVLHLIKWQYLTMKIGYPWILLENHMSHIKPGKIVSWHISDILFVTRYFIYLHMMTSWRGNVFRITGFHSQSTSREGCQYFPCC